MIKIYVMTHKPFQKPEDDIYIPLHVGRALSEDLGYIGDDTGDNISALNCYYGELTGLYWIWKHETEADIVGICHYRRYFLNEFGAFLDRTEYESALADCDVMVSKLLGCAENNWNDYAAYHNAADMKAVGDAIKKIFPLDYKAFCKTLSDTKCCYGNLMVTSLEKYREYCEWLFPVLEEAGKKIDVSEYDVYHKRVFGFLSEILLYVWITARGYRIREGRIGVTAEKAETVEFKHNIERLIKQRELHGAKEFFYKSMQERPDLRLDLSDIKREIPVIEKLLYIMSQEQKSGESGLLDFSKELAVLIEHYRHAYQLIEKHGSSARSAAKAYFEVFQLSDTAFRMIAQDVNGQLSFYHYLNEGTKKKKISVIVPVRHYANTLSTCIANLVHQTLEDIVVIFIDLCQDADGKHLLRECMQQFQKKVQLLMPEEWNRQIEGGLPDESENKNQSKQDQAAAVNSEYVIFIRTEDLADVQMCEKLYNKARENGWNLTGGKSINNKDGNVKSVGPEFISQDEKPIKTDDMAYWGWLIHQDIWKKNRLFFKVNEEGLSDLAETAFQLISDSDSAGNIEDIVYGYCM